MNLTISDRIFIVMENNNLNNNRLAQVLAIQRAVIGEWKTGKSKPSPRLIIKFLELFPEVDANWLIRGTEINNQEQLKVVGNKNITQQSATGSNEIINEPKHQYANSYKKEIEYLKEIIKGKDQQITLLNKLIK